MNADQEWPEAEEVEVAPSAAVPPTGELGEVRGSSDEEHFTFTIELFVILNQSGLLPLNDGVTAHMVVALALIREGDALRVLYSDPAMEGTFLQEGRNAAGVKAVRYVSTPASNTWSVTLDELSRVNRGEVVTNHMNPFRFPADPGPPPRPAPMSSIEAIRRMFADPGLRMPSNEILTTFGRRRPESWYVRHIVSGNRVRAFAHGPSCSFQIDLDTGFVGVRADKSSIRWDILNDEDGYSVCLEAVDLPEAVRAAGLSEIEILQSWHRSRANYLEASGYGEAADAGQAQDAFLLNFRPLVTSIFTGVPDPDGRRPGGECYRVCGGPPDCPDWFSCVPFAASEELACATIIQGNHILFFAIRGHGPSWSRSKVGCRAMRLMHSVLPLVVVA